MIRKALVFFVFLVSGAANAQIPVTVTTDLPGTIAQVANMAKYVEQIVEMKKQLDQAKMMYNSISGIRDIGGLMNDQLAAQFLPPDYIAAFNLLKAGKDGSLSGISGNLNQIARLHQARQCADSGATPEVQRQCKAAWQNMTMNQYVGEQGYAQAAKNIQELQNFVTSIKGAPDQKTIQDLQARIAVEQVKIQNENMKLQTVQMMQKAQEDMRKQNAVDNTKKMLSSSGPIRF